MDRITSASHATSHYVSFPLMEISRAEITTRNRLYLPAREWCAPPSGMRRSRRLGLHGGPKPVLFRIDGKSGGITGDPARARCRILDAAWLAPGHAAGKEAAPLQCVQMADPARRHARRGHCQDEPGAGLRLHRHWQQLPRSYLLDIGCIQRQGSTLGLDASEPE